MFHVRNCSGSVGSIGLAQYGFEIEQRNERLCACVKVQHDAHNRHALEDMHVQGVANVMPHMHWIKSGRMHNVVVARVLRTCGND